MLEGGGQILRNSLGYARGLGGCGSKWKTDVGPQMEMSS